MSRIVCKFGGTSVADIDRIQATADRVKTLVDNGNQVAVVVSAMSGSTDQLIKWTREIATVHDAREYDVVLASGEQVTIVLVGPGPTGLRGLLRGLGLVGNCRSALTVHTRAHASGVNR